MVTTAIYQNRIEDKEVLERFMKLPEEGSKDIELWIPSGPLFSRGYERVVYGDHGPYLEFRKHHILLDLLSKQGLNIIKLPDQNKCKIYYIGLYPVFNKKSFKNIKVYWQIKPVLDKPNAPRREDEKPSCFNRVEGYADYKRGMYYINPYKLERK
jgi:hypothetical protein